MNFEDFGIIVNASYGQVKTDCPKCKNDRRKHPNDKSLSVNIDEGVWHCHHCNWTGSLKRSFVKDVVSQPKIKKQAKKYKLPNWSYRGLPESVISWFAERKISEAILCEAKISFDNGWIEFPYFKSGQCVNVKMRSKDKQFRQSKDAERIVFGYDNIDNEETIIVEGELDALAIMESGLRGVCSVPDGAKGFTFFENVEDRFNEVKAFVIWSDADGPGLELRNELSRRIGLDKCRYVETPEDCKDANDVLIKYGPEVVRKLIEEAKAFPLRGISYANDIDMMTHFLYGRQEGLSVGWQNIDSFWKLNPDAGELVVITGYPGHGKSDWILAVMVNMIMQHEWKFGLFSPEEYPQEDLAGKIAEKFIGLPYRDQFKIRMDQNDINESQAWINDNIFFIQPEDHQLAPVEMVELWKMLVRAKGIKAIICDPWNELDHSVRGAMSETEWFNNQLSMIRRFAREYGVTVFIIAHPKKPYTEEGKAPPVPTPYSINGSASFRNKADVCITVHQPKYAMPDNDFMVELHFQKQKKKYLGKLGVADLHYEYRTGRYSDRPYASNKEL